MGSVKSIKKSKYGGRKLKKIDASLDEKLQSVEWGEYKYSSLFKVVPIKRKLDKTSFSNNGKTPVFSAESRNNGIMGYTDSEADYIVNERNPIYIIFGDHTRSFNISTEDFCVADNVKVLLPKNKLCINTLLFIISAWKKCIEDKGYKRHWSIAQEVEFKLPTKDGKIDFDFMEDFVAELEAQRVAELEAYLSVTGLKDTHLSNEEEQVLLDFDKIQWNKYRIGELFDRIKTKKLPYKAKELPKEAMGKFVLPCLTSSFNNQGLNYFVPKDEATILKNVISIPSNSDVYRAYFQSGEFTVLSDAYAIKWKSSNTNITPQQYLFFVSCINKVTDLAIYSYKNKLGGWNIVKNKYIQVPIRDNQIDFKLMEKLVSAIKKLVIKDVVEYSDKKVQALKTYISK